MAAADFALSDWYGSGMRVRLGTKVFGVGSAYGDALANAGLHPDNPDGMYAQLQSFLTNPVAYKQAQKHWHGPKDALVWYDRHGVSELEWPFHWGKWLDNAPKTDAQIRAVFRIPAGTATEDFLRQAYSHGSSGAFPKGKPWKLDIANWGWDVFHNVIAPVVKGVAYVTTPLGVVEIAVHSKVGRWIIKAQVDGGIWASKQVINLFVPSPLNQVLDAFVDVAGDEMKRAVDGLSVKPPLEIAGMVIGKLQFLGPAGMLLGIALKIARRQQRFDQTFVDRLTSFQPQPGDTQADVADLAALKLLWDTQVSPAIKQIVPPLVRMIFSLAMTGKIRRSDLSALLGNNTSSPVVSHLTHMMGQNDLPQIPLPAIDIDALIAKSPALRDGLQKATSEGSTAGFRAGVRSAAHLMNEDATKTRAALGALDQRGFDAALTIMATLGGHQPASPAPSAPAPSPPAAPAAAVPAPPTAAAAAPPPAPIAMPAPPPPAPPLGAYAPYPPEVAAAVATIAPAPQPPAAPAAAPPPAAPAPAAALPAIAAAPAAMPPAPASSAPAASAAAPSTGTSGLTGRYWNF